LAACPCRCSRAQHLASAPAGQHGPGGGIRCVHGCAAAPEPPTRTATQAPRGGGLPSARVRVHGARHTVHCVASWAVARCSVAEPGQVKSGGPPNQRPPACLCASLPPRWARVMACWWSGAATWRRPAARPSASTAARPPRRWVRAAAAAAGVPAVDTCMHGRRAYGPVAWGRPALPFMRCVITARGAGGRADRGGRLCTAAGWLAEAARGIHAVRPRRGGLQPQPKAPAWPGPPGCAPAGRRRVAGCLCRHAC
jgi:hypothetical protein